MGSQNINYDSLPEHLRGGVARYIEQGIKPGSFLTAIICNNLKDSFFRADNICLERMFDIIEFFNNEAPFRCWGSKEKMTEWIREFGKEIKGD